LKAGPAGGKNRGGAKRSAAGILSRVAGASLIARSDPWKDVPMIVVKHRWMKNRNVTIGSTIISFNNEGLAHVRHVGNAIINVEIYVRNSKGLAEIVEDPRKPAPVPKVSTPIVSTPAPVVPPVSEPEFEVREEVGAKEKKPKTAKKVSKKKPPGKKSSWKKR
jgi:hypothetical protein